MSTFGLLRTAYSGLAAARAALDVTGQNVANVNTAGYSRQRVDQAAMSAASSPTIFTSGVNIGSGVAVLGISRITDGIADARVRDTASTSGYWSVTSAAASTVEAGLGEPGDTGLSATLGDLWAAWQQMGTAAHGSDGTAGQAKVLLNTAADVVSQIADGRRAAASAWSDARTATTATVDQINAATTSIAQLNGSILKATAQGGNANEMIDSRDTALASLARLAGATSRPNPDGTLDVVIGGNTVVSGSHARQVRVVGAADLEQAGTAPVQVELADHPGVPLQVDGGELAGRLTTLASANGTGIGGVFAEAAKTYDDLATSIATEVNAVHRTGTTPGGATGSDFFALNPGSPPALGLRVVPTDASGIATGAAAAGPSDNSVADAIGQLGSSKTGVDAQWTDFVSRAGSLAASTGTRSTIADQASTSASTARTSVSGVDLDEETSNLVMYQHAYQGAARVITAVDEMLDTLINKTGLVGR